MSLDCFHLKQTTKDIECFYIKKERFAIVFIFIEILVPANVRLGDATRVGRREFPILIFFYKKKFKLFFETLRGTL